MAYHSCSRVEIQGSQCSPFSPLPLGSLASCTAVVFFRSHSVLCVRAFAHPVLAPCARSSQFVLPTFYLCSLINYKLFPPIQIKGGAWVECTPLSSYDKSEGEGPQWLRPQPWQNPKHMLFKGPFQDGPESPTSHLPWDQSLVL